MGKSGLATATLGAALASALFLWPTRGDAEGALVVGVPPDVAQSGVALGYSFNYATAEEASKEAMSQCRLRGEAVKPPIADLCTQVGKTFHDQCVAVAMDPQEGTPGVGWAIAPSKAAAEEEAMANCVATAGADRREYCKVSSSRCDGTAQ